MGIESEDHIGPWTGLFSGFRKDADRTGVPPEEHHVNLHVFVRRGLQGHTEEVEIEPSHDGLFPDDTGFNRLDVTVTRNGVPHQQAGATEGSKNDIYKVDYNMGGVANMRKFINEIGAYLEDPKDS